MVPFPEEHGERDLKHSVRSVGAHRTGEDHGLWPPGGSVPEKVGVTGCRHLGSAVNGSWGSESGSSES